MRSSADVSVSAIDDARLSASDSSYIGSWSGYGGMIVTNLVLSGADAWIAGSDVATSAGASVSVDAQHVSTLDASVLSKIEAWDAIGAVAAFNSIGWHSQNLLFNALDALLGDPAFASIFGPEPAEARAWIADTRLDVAGDLSVTATSAAQLTAVAGSENVAEAQLDLVFSAKAQAKGVAGGGILASNKVAGGARAWIAYGGARGHVDVGGTVTVSAQDAAGIDATSTVVQVAITANTTNGLIAVAQSLNLVVIPGDYDFTSASGVRELAGGERVRIGASATGGGDFGSVYEYLGPDGDVDLATSDYADGSLWKKIIADEDNPTEGDLNSLFDGVSNLNVTDSDARAIGILVLLNDLRSTSTRSSTTPR